MIENITQTAFIFALLFWLTIVYHKERGVDPADWIKLVEVIGILSSFATCIAGLLILIWMT